MIAAINHKALPFFDRVPVRARIAVLRAVDRVETRDTAEHQHLALSLDLRPMGVEPPTFDEFKVWIEEVRLGRIGRGDYAEKHVVDAYVIGPVTGRPVRPVIEAVMDTRSGHVEHVNWEAIETDANRLNQAKAIVKAAHALFEAKVDGGYSPLSVALDDTIVAEALKDVIEAQASAQIMDADVRMTPGNKLVDLLLGESTDDIDAKMVDILTIDMQQELCAILVKSGLTEGGAA